MPPSTKSPLVLHMEKWKGGCGADICGRSQRVCHIRGSVPCDVVFIGEAPGDSEDVLGRPFVGPAGANFQKKVIQECIPHKVVTDPKTKETKWVTTGVTYALMNLVGCIPRDSSHIKEGPPDPDDVVRCAPRLLELLNICKPKLIVCIGNEARDSLDPFMKSSVLNVNKTGHKFHNTPRIHVLHPAYILSKLHLTNQGLAWQRASITIGQAIDRYILHPEDYEDSSSSGDEPDTPNGSGVNPDDFDPIPF